MNIYIALALVGWIFYARLVRARGHRAEACGLRHGGAHAGLQRAAHRLPPYPAQRDHAGHRLLDVGCRCSTSCSARPSAFSASASSRRPRNGALMIAEGQDFIPTAWWIDRLPRPRHRAGWPPASACWRTASPRSWALRRIGRGLARHRRSLGGVHDVPAAPCAPSTRSPSSSRPGEMLGIVGESGSRQDRGLPLDPASAAQQPRPASPAGRDVRRARSAGPAGGRAPPAPRRRHRHDLPEPHDRISIR